MFRRLFVAINNRITRLRNVKAPSGSVLLLLPHCLQRTGCAQNVIHGVEACMRCGRCDVSGLIALRDSLGVQCSIAGGGRQASQIVRDRRVRAVVAVACEKELVDGIVASFPKPVLAVPNSRPNGPCRDTRVDIESVRRALESVILDTE